MNPIAKITWGITAIISLCSASLAFLVNGDHLSLNLKIFYAIILFLLATAICIFIFFETRISKVIESIAFRISKQYTPFIYNSIKVRIEYIRFDGSLVSYERNNHITKLSLRRSNKALNIEFDTDGEIIKESTYSINCSYSFPTNQSAVFHCNFEKQNVFEKQYFVGQAFLIKNGFTNKLEYWTFYTERYCNQYCLEIVVPEDKKVKDAYLLVKEGGKNVSSNWVRISTPQLMWKYRKSENIISARITAFKPKSTYKLVWEFI